MLVLWTFNLSDPCGPGVSPFNRRTHPDIILHRTITDRTQIVPITELSDSALILLVSYSFFFFEDKNYSVLILYSLEVENHLNTPLS